MSENAHQCQEEVGEPPGYWHWHRCGRKAKFRTITATGKPHLVCTQHAKPYRRNRPVEPLECDTCGRVTTETHYWTDCRGVVCHEADAAIRAQLTLDTADLTAAESGRTPPP